MGQGQKSQGRGLEGWWPNGSTLSRRVGAYQGNLYLALEYVEGETLRTWLKEPRTWQEVVAVMKGAALGLAAAHAGGIIHRDFKPANVIVAKDGRVGVLDFGIASANTQR